MQRLFELLLQGYKGSMLKVGGKNGKSATVSNVFYWFTLQQVTIVLSPVCLPVCLPACLRVPLQWTNFSVQLSKILKTLQLLVKKRDNKQLNSYTELYCNIATIEGKLHLVSFLF